MAALALGLVLTYLLSVFGLGSLLRRRATGSSGWMGAGATLAERVANVLFLGGCALDVLTPVLVLSGALHPWDRLDAPGVHVAGAVLVVAAMLGARFAQHTMGADWRTGIAPDAPSTLVTGGAFALVRNPVYTTMLATSFGSALIVPSALALAALPLCLLALELQTRLVEEPFLSERHGAEYRRYAGGVGRFLPGLGRLRAH